MADDNTDMLDSQLSNELASEAIAEVIDTAEDTGQQMDITDAINATKQDTAPVNLDTPPPPRAEFIPAAPTKMPDEESVDMAAQTPVTRPSSLINRISGLWSSKPESRPAELNDQSRSEPALDEAAAKEQIAVSILDLSRSDMVGKATERAPAKAPNAEEDDLDIPAFLRRQAN
jgi:cell division protein FtsZ